METVIFFHIISTFCTKNLMIFGGKYLCSPFFDGLFFFPGYASQTALTIFSRKIP